MSALLRRYRWTLLSILAIASVVWLSVRVVAAPVVANWHRACALQDSLEDITASLSVRREAWGHLRDGGDQTRNESALTLAQLDSLLATCGLDHPPLKASTSNSRLRLPVPFKGTSFGLHRAWRRLAGWHVVDWSIRPNGDGIQGTFLLEMSQEGMP